MFAVPIRLGPGPMGLMGTMGHGVPWGPMGPIGSDGLIGPLGPNEPSNGLIAHPYGPHRVPWPRAIMHRFPGIGFANG